MIIYKFKNYSYSTDDLFFDRVCEVKGVELYPVKARDYEEFLKYANYLIFSKKHLGIDNYANGYGKRFLRRRNKHGFNRIM